MNYQILNLATPFFPFQGVMAQLDCDAVDASSNGQCDQDLDQSDTGFTDCNDDGINNCIDEQVVSVHNALNRNEEAKIDQSLKQLLDCDNNMACENSVLNDGFQGVFVENEDSPSTVDFDVGQTMTQTLAQGGQSNFLAQNIGSQVFDIVAGATSTVDADSDGAENVKMIMTQLTDECDGSPNSVCTNNGEQRYNVRSFSDSFVDISTDQGLEMTQKNIDCDNGVSCLNDAKQLISIEADGSAFVDFETDSTFSDFVQTNDCETKGASGFTCVNELNAGGFATVSIDATDNSEVDVDKLGQDASQLNDCYNVGSDGCVNSGEFTFRIGTIEGSATVDVEGSQDLTQENYCDNGSTCSNSASLSTGLEQDHSASFDSEFTQQVSQFNDCTNGADCVNDATMRYSLEAQDGSIIKSKSDQQITQINTCSNNQNCMNVGIVNNNVFAANTAHLNADSSQTLTQSCTILSGQPCLNMNTVQTSGRATSNAVLNYVTSQNIQNPSDGSGTASISIVRNSGTSNVGPISQTSNGVITP